MNKIALLPAGKKYKKNIKDAASEALGTQTSHEDRKAAKTPWFCQEIKDKCKKKRKAYLNYRNVAAVAPQLARWTVKRYELGSNTGPAK